MRSNQHRRVWFHPTTAGRWLPAAMLAVLALGACQREPPTLAQMPAPKAPPSVQQGPLAVPAPAVADAPAAATRVTPPPAAPLLPRVEAVPAQSRACLAQLATPAPSRSVSVHRWVDASGITHYSDQPAPAAAKDQRVIEVRGLPSIEVQASGYDVDLPDHLQQRAVADALGVQRALRDSLGVPTPAGSTLHVVFVRDAKAYAGLIGDPVLAASVGAYSPEQRAIYVRLQARDEDSFAVLRHEMTHALVHESIGNLPTPINEGLAEYFSRYHVAGMGGQVDIGADRAALVQAAPAGDGSEALVDLLARDGADFYATDGAPGAREQRYLRAYALIAMLMRDLAGGDLSALVTAQRADPCRPVAAEKVLDAHAHGGLHGLAQRWVAFMRDPPADIQAY